VQLSATVAARRAYIRCTTCPFAPPLAPGSEPGTRSCAVAATLLDRDTAGQTHTCGREAYLPGSARISVIPALFESLNPERNSPCGKSNHVNRLSGSDCNPPADIGPVATSPRGCALRIYDRSTLVACASPSPQG
jgi:hypothetical protein